MAEALMEMAEEHFRDGKIVEAYELSKFAWHLDPYLGTFHKYHASYRIHFLANRQHKEPNWYEILGLPCSASPDSVAHAFCRVGKLVNPEKNGSAAAKKAYKLAVEAFEVLSDDDKRKAFRRRMGITEPERHKEEKKEPATPSLARNVNASSSGVVAKGPHSSRDTRRTRYQPYHDHRRDPMRPHRIGE